MGKFCLGEPLTSAPLDQQDLTHPSDLNFWCDWWSSSMDNDAVDFQFDEL
jgi:hypothetical protein